MVKSRHFSQSQLIVRQTDPAEVLIHAADALQERVEKWKRPPLDEEDADRSDYREIQARRFKRVFLDPIRRDLDAACYKLAMNALLFRSPKAGKKLRKSVAKLKRAQRTVKDLRNSENEEAFIQALADTAWEMVQFAVLLKNDGKAKQPELEDSVEPESKDANVSGGSPDTNVSEEKTAAEPDTSEDQLKGEGEPGGENANWSKARRREDWAGYYGCSPTTFDRRRKPNAEGHIRTKKDGKKIKVHVDDLPPGIDL